MKNSYLVFGTQLCSYCTRAKKLLDEKGIVYTYTDVSALTEQEQENLMTIANKRFTTVPQIFEETEDGLSYVGGYTELDTKLNGLGDMQL